MLMLDDRCLIKRGLLTYPLREMREMREMLSDVHSVSDELMTSPSDEENVPATKISH